MKVPFYKHSIGEDEKAAIAKSLDLDFLTTGIVVEQFESEFSQYTGANYAVGLTSCTAALHLALLAYGIGADDEVITTPMTFAATSLAIIHTGAIPVWVDVEPTTGNIDANLIEAAITSKTKAILPVHLYGQMCDMVKIRAIANKHNLVVIEDAAHALESTRGNIRVGQLADATCFSFYATKSITCGEGGALTTNNKEIYNRVKILRTHGMSADAAKRFGGSFSHWDILEFGWKYNMSNISASMLLPQLKKIEAMWAKRKEACEIYNSKISTIPNVHTPSVLAHSKHGHHLYTVQVDPEKRDTIIGKLNNDGIGCTVNYRAVHTLAAFASKYQQIGKFPVAEKIGAATIALPLYPSLTIDQIYYVTESLRKCVQ